nr:helix-turn-helix transcriptional regulator [Micromonospora sp. DSM 115978]
MPGDTFTASDDFRPGDFIAVDVTTDDLTAGHVESTSAASLSLAGFWPGEDQLGPAWALAGRGQFGPARSALLAGAGLAHAAGHRSSEAMLLTDIARLGGAATVTDRLSELAAESEGVLVPARATYVAALAAAEPQLLLAAAAQLSSVGADLLAAEAAAVASAALRRAGESRAATAAAVLARGSAELCQGTRTPLLAGTEAAVGLSEREREVAHLAAAGSSARQIARTLTLSVRTVENHLQKTYRKLGVSSRADL